jgi:hypothetical protein
MNNNERVDDSKAPSLRWLLVGAVVGLLAAAYGLLEQQKPDGPLAANVVARVNGRTISRERFERAVQRAGLNSDQEISSGARVAVLQRMIEEELLVQRGAELGMIESDNEVRAAIVQSLIASVTAEADAANPSDAELTGFLQENVQRYTFANALSVDAWISDDEQSAQEFAARLREGEIQRYAGDDFGDVRPVPGLPTGALPIERLRMFLGPGISGSITGMADGTIAVFARQNKWYIVRTNSHLESVVPGLETIRSQVLIDFRRGLADKRLRDYVEELQSRSDVEIAGP